MSSLFWLSDAQMAQLQPFFPKSHGKPRVEDRRVLSGIIFINRNGLRCGAIRRRRSTTVGSGGGESLNTIGSREATNTVSSSE